MLEYERDITNTSSRLRKKAIEIILKAKRPMAVSEIRNYIRNNDPEMWNEISEKCNDYVRVILSLTKNTLITKYRCLRPIHGIDRRSTFYGLTSTKYSEEEWRKLDDDYSPKKDDAKCSSPKKAPIPKPIEVKSEKEEKSAEQALSELKTTIDLSQEKNETIEVVFNDNDDDNIFIWKKRSTSKF